MQLSRIAVIGTTVCACALAGNALAQPNIGGDPIFTDEVYFTADSWGMTAYSYVFDASVALPPGFVLDPGEMLFAYLLEGDEMTTVSVAHYSVGNPNLLPITAVGFETGIVPPGFDGGLLETPFLYGYSGPAQATVYTYAGDLTDPFCTLDPGEWSLVWYIAEATGWEMGPGTATGAGISDNQFVPVPVPAPGALMLLGVAGLLGARRRRG